LRSREIFFLAIPRSGQKPVDLPGSWELHSASTLLEALMKITSLISVVLFSLVASGANAVQLLKHEPGAGQVRSGAVVWVDDGTCPKGKVKRILGGNKKTGTARRTTCEVLPKG
jgi:hypothetical protein